MSEPASADTENQTNAAAPEQTAAEKALAEWYAPVQVHLKNPWLAALYAWLWPGAGHLYQGRTGKGILFMVCVLATYFFGFALGGGRVVYASFGEIRNGEKSEFRYAYLCQAGVGIPALPALIQRKAGPVFGIESMMPPVPARPGQDDMLAEWHRELKGFFEIATLYTMIAGLLNMLAIYDAFAGPVFPQPEEKKKRGPPEDGKTNSMKQSKSTQPT